MCGREDGREWRCTVHIFFTVYGSAALKQNAVMLECILYELLLRQ